MSSPDIKFLADANIAPSVIQTLRAVSFDVKSVSEDDKGELTDLNIIHWAVREDRVILTHDKDFGNVLVYPVSEHKGVLLIRLHDQRPENVIENLVKLLKKVPARIFKGNLVVMTDQGIRIYEE